MSNSFYKVEFDPSFFGGSYSSQGNFVLVPEYLVDELGMDKAFEKTTGHVAANIVHYSEDDRFNALGEFLLDMEEVPTVEVAPEPVVELAPEPVVELEPEPLVELPAELTAELAEEPVVEMDTVPAVEVSAPRGRKSKGTD